MLWVGAVGVVILGAHAAHKLALRPQRGVLLLAALAPFDGLLLLIEDPGLLAGWKEGLVLVTLGATYLSPRETRAERPGFVPAWLPPLLGLLLLGLVSFAWTDPAFAISGLKIDFFYPLLTLAIWRCPLGRDDRDDLVTVLMAGGFITAVIGIGQQLVGASTLNRFGYEFDTVIRTTGDSVLRSFSTFDLPFPFAFYVVFVLAVCVPVALHDLTRLRNRLFLAVSPVLVVGLVSAVVRAAILAALLAATYLVARRYRGVLSLAPSTLLIVAIVPASLWGTALSPNSLNDRVSGWTVVTDTIAGHPLGTGLGTTGAAAEAATERGGDLDQSFDLPPDLLPYQPDNYYIKRVLELGPIGLWLTIVMLRHVIGTARATRDRAGPSDQPLIDGFLAATLGAMAAAAVATYWEIFPLDLYFWMMLGVLTSIDRAESSSPDWPSDPTAAAYRPTFASS